MCSVVDSVRNVVVLRDQKRRDGLLSLDPVQRKPAGQQEQEGSAGIGGFAVRAESKGRSDRDLQKERTRIAKDSLHLDSRY